jgi:hypothetical protein
MLYRQSSSAGSGYLRGDTPLSDDVRTNKQSFTFDNDMIDGPFTDFNGTYSLSKKGEG